MALSYQAKQDIAAIVREFMGNIITRRVSEPFNEQAEALKRPFDYALVPVEIWKGAKFERSYVTTKGMAGFEQIARRIAEDRGYEAETGHQTTALVYSRQLEVISAILQGLENKRGGKRPSWHAEVQSVLAAHGTGMRDAPVTVTTDLWVKKRDGEHFFEIKSSLPNSDQTKVSKEKMLKLKALNSAYHVYFALPDNPYGTRDAYNHSHAMKWFDMRRDECVVIGEEFWDGQLGGPGTTKELVAIFAEVGKETKRRIRKDYLGL